MINLLARNTLVGTWTLLSYSKRALGGSVEYPLGQNPVGLLIYSTDGYMSAQFMAGSRAMHASDVFQQGTEEEMARAARSYFAYSGRYQFNEDDGLARHYPIVSLFPNWVGTTQLRVLQLREGYLELNHGTTILTHLTWRRAG